MHTEHIGGYSDSENEHVEHMIVLAELVDRVHAEHMIEHAEHMIVHAEHMIVHAQHIVHTEHMIVHAQHKRLSRG